MYIIGDVHGCFDTLQKLLSKIDWKTHGICFLGDLIDRGPKSAQVVKLVREMMANHDNVYCVAGNHEQMMVESVDEDGLAIGLGSIWLPNGGKEAVKSYEGLYGDSQESMLVYDMLWMQKLPNWVHLPHIKVNDKELVLSHSHLTHLVFENIEEKKEWHREFVERHVKWCRYIPESEMDDKYFNVVGHTILEEGYKISEKHAIIDTGCFLGGDVWVDRRTDETGKLTALKVPELTIIQEEYCEEE